MEKSYKQLVVWQRSIELVNEIYRITQNFPTIEKFGLVSQMRRCAVSIPSNIAEGYKRRKVGEYLHFLGIADASSAELETQLIISKTNYSLLNYNKAEALLIEVQKMLFVLIRRLSEKTTTLKTTPL